MKNLVLVIALFICAYSYAQTVEVDEVALPAEHPGIERVFVEKWSGGNVPAGNTTYRVYIDIETEHKLVNVFGNKVGSLIIEPTNGQFYNDAFGAALGDLLNSALFAVFPSSEFDTYLSVGGCANDRIAVPHAVNSLGYIAGTPATTSTSPGLDVSMFGTASTATSFNTDGGLWNIPGGISYEAIIVENTIMIGQFTTNANLSMTLNIDLITKSSTKLKTTFGIIYPNTTTDISKVSIADGIRLYPNPVVDQLSIDITNNTLIENAPYTIYDATGKKVKDGIFTDSSNPIDMSGYKNGFYIIKIKTSSETFNKVFIKK